MKKLSLIIVAVSFMAVFSFAGCAQQPKADNAQQAIDQSKSMATVEEQVKYLVGQANAFVNSKDFDQATQTVQYVLSNLDANSQEAKSVLEKAAAEMRKVAEQKAEELKKTLGGLGK